MERIKLFLYLSLAWFLFSVSIQPFPNPAEAASIYPEGRDFATVVLKNPWDMSEFSDISQYLNISGQQAVLQNIRVENGVFSAQATSLRDYAQFFPLFPGYQGVLLTGKIGHNYPIKSSTYKYLFIAMKVDSGPPDPTWPDYFQIFWFSDERMNNSGGIWGYTKGHHQYPEAGLGTPVPQWKLFKVDLSDPSNLGGGTSWTGYHTWKGLRIDPTVQANVAFQVDWVRLTDGSPILLPLSWSGTRKVSILVRPENTSREILMADNVEGSSYSLDLQGLSPGKYTYLVKAGGTLLVSGNFEVNRAPIVEFTRPSFTSGEDYATSSGNPWDMGDSSDVLDVACTQAGFSGGILSLDTPSVAQQQGTCNGGGVSDPRIPLRTFSPLDTRQYRYLSFRMLTEGPYENMPGGMIVRWIWSHQTSGGTCYLVSYGIPLDVGWHTYHVDLFALGSPEATAGSCPPSATHWLNTSPVTSLRFDPNENILGSNLHQEIDWIRLTKVDRVKSGNPFPVKISLNKPVSQVSLSFYYTTDRLNAPFQRAALGLSQGPPSLTGDGYKLFLPLTVSRYEFADTPWPNNLTFNWDTANVPAGEYYLCVQAGDAYQQAVYCSEAPLQVLTPDFSAAPRTRGINPHPLLIEIIKKGPHPGISSGEGLF